MDRKSRLAIICLTGACLFVVALLAEVNPGSARQVAIAPTLVLRGLNEGCGVGVQPSQPAFDNSTGTFYIPNNLSSNVTIFRAGCHNNSSIYFGNGSRPDGSAYDPSDHEVYVSDYALSKVYILRGATIVATLHGGGIRHPSGAFYDALSREILIPNIWGHDVSVLRGSKVLGQFQTGASPASIAVDTASNSIWVVNRQSSNITIVSNASAPIGAPERSISNGRLVQYVVHDSADGLEYVSNGEANGSVGPIYPNGTFAPPLSAGFRPEDSGFSPTSAIVYVAMSMHSLYEISGQKVVKQLGFYYSLVPTSFVYDSWNGRMYVTLDGSGVRDSLFELPP